MKIYLIAALAAFILFAFCTGVRVGDLQCQRSAARQHATAQQTIIQQQVTTHAETMHTGMRDIRRVLREKYTIAE